MRSRRLRGRWTLLFLLSSACEPKSAPAAHVAPVVVEHPVPESELTRVRFSARAAQRLALERAVVQAESVPSMRLYGGDVIIPPGRSLIVTAPVSGELHRASKEVPVLPGAAVHQGDVLLTLVPFAPLDRDVRARAEREVSATSAQLSAAEARVTRLSQLGAERAVSRRAYEEAVAARDILRADVRAAQSRASSMRVTPLLSDVGLTIKAPSDGVIRTLSALPGQAVSAGASLLEIVQVSSLQVRVALYAGDLARREATQAVRIRALSAPLDQSYAAGPIAGPPTAAPERATVDQYFALPADAPFLPGERVLVELPLKLVRNARSVPRAALVYDAAGAGWVYACAGDLAYTRTRIDPVRVTGESVIFERGPALGSCIASVGAAEIFGSEFEPGH
ncbi:MAG: Nickel-cobalt-cadmium resistance protein NccB [Myxococcaceae bacterium]|nr:Nickel-cobalt-cadmium resistance protein NccB [Myxococcaceae bacterium]